MTQISRPLSGQFFRKNGGFQEEGDESYLLLFGAQQKCFVHLVITL
jgi:hypothetical protein